MKKVLKFKVMFNPSHTSIVVTDTVSAMRAKVRKICDKFGDDDATVTGYNVDGKPVYLSCVRSTKTKHFPVATATRG